MSIQENYCMVLKKVIKRLAFESSKRRKRLQHFFYNESECDLRHGNYQENDLTFLNLNNLEEYYKLNETELCRELASADLILDGKLNLLYFDNEIDVTDWNKDYSSGLVYPIKYFGDIKYIVEDLSTDVKNVWEFSRLHHLVIVAKAYFLTKEKKYYFYVREKISSWLEENPIASSVNWTCNMEVAIRVFNLIIIYSMIKGAFKDDESIKVIIKSLIYHHNKHIRKNLENYSDNRNNHYLSNLLGLLVSAKFLVNKNNSKYKKQQLFSVNELEKEIEKQIFDDGVTYEISTSYQKLVFEILLFSFIVGENAFSKSTIEKLGKMLTFLKSIVYQDGTIPLIGDNDSGNILVFEDYFNDTRSNLKSLLSLAENVLCGQKNTESALTSFFCSSNNDFYCNEQLNKNYPDAGYFIIENEFYRVILLCGPLSLKGQGGHSHNDQLSFVLDVRAKPFFIDTGTITYTGNRELRNFSRKTSSHNTVSIENEEQNIIGDDLFAMEERTYSVCSKHTNTEFVGCHKGYKSSLNVVHERRVYLSDKKVTIIDFLLEGNTESKVKATQNFILAKGIEARDCNGFLELRDNERKLLTNMSYNDCEIKNVHVSDRYGRYFYTIKIRYHFKGKSEIIMELQ